MTPGAFFALPARERLVIIAIEQIDRDTCTCGQPWSESTDPEARTDYRARDIVCHACRVVDAARDKAPAGARIYAEKVWDHVKGVALVDDIDDFDAMTGR